MGGIEAIGGTPVVLLAGDYGAELWVKLEAANPTSWDRSSRIGAYQARRTASSSLRPNSATGAVWVR